MRGFVLSGGNPAFLDPYMQGRADEHRDAAAIRGFVTSGDHPTVAADLAAVERPPCAVAERLRAAALARSPTAPDPDQGKELFDASAARSAGSQADLSTERLPSRGTARRRGDNLAWVGAGITVMIAGSCSPPRSGCGVRCCGRCRTWRPRCASSRPATWRTRSRSTGRGRSSIWARTSTRCAWPSWATSRRRGHQPAPRRAGPGAGAVQQRPRAVRLRREPRPAGAAAQGRQLLPAAAAPLRGQARRAGRPVHRVRGRRRRAHAAADQRPARVLPGRPHHRGVHRGRPRRRRRRGRRPARTGPRRRRRRDRGRVAADRVWRRVAAAGAVRQPDRQRAEVPPRGRAAARHGVGAARSRTAGRSRSPTTGSVSIRSTSTRFS